MVTGKRGRPRGSSKPLSDSHRAALSAAAKASPRQQEAHSKRAATQAGDMWPSWLKKSNPTPQPEEVVAQKMIDLAFCPRCQVQGLTVTRFRGGFEQGTAFCPVGHRARWQMRSGVMEVFGR